MSFFKDQQPSIVLMDREFPVESLSNAPALDLRNINDVAWKQILSRCVAVELRLYHLTTGSLQGIETLRGTLRLAVEWGNRIYDLSPLFRMPWLQGLYVCDFRLLRSLEGIDALQNLTELHLSGNLGSLHPPLRL